MHRIPKYIQRYAISNSEIARVMLTPLVQNTAPTVLCKLLLSPVRSATGKLHWKESYHAPGNSLQEYLPHVNNATLYVIVNGKHIPQEEYNTYLVKPSTEIIIKCYWGWIAGVLINVAISILISIAISAIMYFAFPIKPQKLREPHEAISESWEGVTTTQGPGGSVAISYGRRKVGGQLLSSYFSTEKVTGGGGPGSVAITANNLQSKLFILLAIGEGEINDILENSITLNNQPLSNFRDVEVTSYVGLPVTTLNFTEVKNSYPAGDIDLTLALTTYTTIDSVDTFILEVDFSQGLFHINRNGGSSPNTSTYQYRYKKFGTGTYSDYTPVTTMAEIHGVGHSPIRQEVTELARYDIEVSFVNATETNVSRSAWKPFLHAVTEILYVEQSYPNTALLQIDAVANENLQGALPNVQVIIEGLKVRVGSFGATPTYSNNNAWCLMDIMTNTRYGRGIADAEINLASFITFADYCDELVDIDTDGDNVADTTEKRSTLDYILDTDKNPIDVYEEILSGTRGILIKTEGQWKVKIAQDDTVQQLITWAYTLRDSVIITYLRDVDALNVMEGRFANETRNYEQDVAVYPSIDNWPAFINKTSVEFAGVTRNTQVLRELFFRLQARDLPKLSVEFEMSLAGLTCEVMDIFNFSYPRLTEGISGRIASTYGTEINTTTQFILDEDFTYQVGEEYTAFIHFKDDSLITRLIENPATSINVTSRLAVLLTGEPVLPFPPEEFESRFAIGRTVETIVLPFRITSLTRTNTFNVKITAIHHVPEVYTEYLALDDGNAPILPSYTSTSEPPPLTSLTAHEVAIFDNEYNELLNLHVQLDWTVAAIDSNPTVAYAPYGGVRIYAAQVDKYALFGSFEFGQVEFSGFNSDTTSFITLATLEDAYVFMWRDSIAYAGTPQFYHVVPISMQGVPNNNGALSIVFSAIGESFMPPDDPTATAISISVINLTWVNHEDPRLVSIAIYRATSNNFTIATYVTLVALPTNSYSDTGLSGATTYYYFFVPVDIYDKHGINNSTANATTF
jgi:predicted phage tail protein